jgi:hypothetical protein
LITSQRRSPNGAIPSSSANASAISGVHCSGFVINPSTSIATFNSFVNIFRSFRDLISSLSIVHPARLVRVIRIDPFQEARLFPEASARLLRHLL